MVFENGKKVLLELNATSRAINNKKIEQYLTLGEKTDFDVLYLLAPKSDKKDIANQTQINLLKKNIKSVSQRHSTNALKKIKFISWDSYFPALKEVDANCFMGLKAYCYDKKIDNFVFENIVDKKEYEPLKKGLNIPYGVPYWQRKEQDIDLGNIFLRENEVFSLDELKNLSTPKRLNGNIL